MTDNGNDRGDDRLGDELRLAQLRLTHEEDQWAAQWLTPSGPPRNSPDIRPYVKAMDDLLLKAAQVIEVGVALSPMTIQLVKNAIVLYDAGKAVERGQLSPEAYDDLCRWINPGSDPNDQG